MVKYQAWLTPEGLERLRQWEEEGLTYKEIVRRIGISEFTLKAWRRQFPEIADIFSQHEVYQKWLTPAGLETLRGWAKEGMTLNEITARAGITLSTMHRWKHQYPEIADALNQRKTVDYVIQNALFLSAIGYDTTESREVPAPDGGILTVTTKKHIPGNVNAIQTWLRTRLPEEWK